MGAADLHDLELIWPSSRPTNVIVTGTFDQWSSSIHLVRGDTGFFGTVKVPWGQKIAYKFIVDGRWQCRDDSPQEDDGHGNINNILRTPEKPQAVSPTVLHDPPARLSIPLEHEVETMVTAVEFLPPVEPVVVRGSLLVPVPQISVDGLGLTPSDDTPVSASKLDTATATEGTVPPASAVPAEVATFRHESPSSGVPAVSNSSSDLPPLANGDEQVHESHGHAAHARTQLTTLGELSASSVPETKKEAMVASVLTTPQSDHSLQGVQDAPPTTDHIGNSSTRTPIAVLEPTAKQPEVLSHEIAGQRHQLATAPTSTSQTSPSSTPASSTLTHKKRRSLFAKIKHIFEKDNKRERK